MWKPEDRSNKSNALEVQGDDFNDPIEEFKFEWDIALEDLFDLTDNKDDFNLKTQLSQVFHDATPTGKKLLVKPTELLVRESEEDVYAILEDLEKKGIPGGSALKQACRKFKLEIILEEVVNYFKNLGVEEIGCIDMPDYQKSSPLIPGLPNHVSVRCIAKIPVQNWGPLLRVSKAWLNLYVSRKLFKAIQSNVFPLRVI